VDIRKKIEFTGFVLVLVLFLSGIQAVFAGTAEQSRQTEAQVIRKKFVTVPAAAFAPSTDGYTYFNDGHYLYVNAGFPAKFTAPVFVPHKAVLKSIALFYNDYNAGGDACVSLFVSPPLLDTTNLIRKVCTSGSSGNMEKAVKVMSITVADGKALYLMLEFNVSSVEVYAVKIGYK